jgi:hypothetical protein
MRFAALLLLAITAIPAHAEQPGSFLLITADGYYGIHWLAGAPRVIHYRATIDLTDIAATSPPVPPEPLPPPAPEVPEDGLASEVQSWAESVGDPIGAVIIARIYRNAATAVQGGSIGIDDVSRNIGQQIDQGVPDAGQWADFRRSISAAWAERYQRGELSTAEQWVEFLAQIASGLEAVR